MPEPQMRIGLSTTMIQRGKSGVAQYVLALLRALLAEASAHRWTVFVLEEDLPLFEFAKDRAEVVTVPEVFRPAIRNILWHQVSLPALARQLGLDVLHIPSYRRLIWRKPCALVATIHDLAPFEVKGKYDPARMFYGKVVVRQLARRQDRIIAVSAGTARDVERYFGVPLGRLQVILNGIDHTRFNPGDRAAAKGWVRERWGLKAPFFLYVSRLEHPAKNHFRLIEAFSRFKRAERSPWLLVLGGSDWHGAEVIREAAKASAFQSDIRFLGFVADEELPGLYRAADAFVYPSLFEGFGFPPVEAMACGCPVVSSARGSLAEVVADAAALVNPEDPDDLASQMKRVATDEPFRASLVTKGYQNARRFDWQANARAVLGVYRGAVALSSSGVRPQP
ncbi:MAG: glycosyltransferase family 4 protein [Verrucomicrobiia bacterium]